MTRERAWSVQLHDDDINTIEGVVYVLREVLGFPIEGGVRAARDVERDGTVVLERYESQDKAESLVARLQIFGLTASMKWT